VSSTFAFASSYPKAFASRYPRASALGLSGPAKMRGFSPWGMLSYLRLDPVLKRRVFLAMPLFSAFTKARIKGRAA
jgi:hypothetical protein